MHADSTLAMKKLTSNLPSAQPAYHNGRERRKHKRRKKTSLSDFFQNANVPNKTQLPLKGLQSNENSCNYSGVCPAQYPARKETHPFALQKPSDLGASCNQDRSLLSRDDLGSLIELSDKQGCMHAKVTATTNLVGCTANLKSVCSLSTCDVPKRELIESIPKLNTSQQRVLDLVNNGKNVFFTGTYNTWTNHVASTNCYMLAVKGLVVLARVF
jgi:hypothetical protein